MLESPTLERERRPEQSFLHGETPLFHAYAEALFVPIFVFDLNSILFANHAATLLTGYSADQLGAMSFLQLVHPAFQQSVSDTESARLNPLSPPPPCYPFRIVTAKQAERWVNFSALRILYDDQGAVMGTAIDFTEHKRAQQEIALLAHAVKDLREAACVTISTETTALKQAEQAARVSEQRYGVILQSISDEALIVDEHGLIETINDAAALRANQASRSPTPGLRLIDIYPRDFVRRRSVAVKKVLLQKEPLHITEKLSYGFQHTWLSTKINPLLGQDGSCTKVVLVSRDVTMEKEREEFLRSFSRSILSAQEEERKRVSRELHDGLAQSLAALRMDLTRLGNQPAADQRTWESQTGRAIATVSLLIDETRRIAQNLTPAILEDIGLTTAIRKLVSEFAAAHGMKSRWHLSNIDDYFTQAEAIHIYRVIQEVTNNIERHSLARNITVSIQCQNGGVEFLILDDGVGFDTGQALASSTVGGNHRGLRGLQERARLLEGSLEITSAPGEGTLVALRIPTTGKRGN